MDKVLIVGNARENLKKIQQGFKDLHHFDLLTAADAEDAINTLKKIKISVFVTNIRLPNVDGVELLAYMTRNHRATPCIAVLEEEQPKPWFIDRTGHEDVLYYLEKPFEFSELANIIFVGLNLKDEGLTLKGMTLKNFLPLIELSRKTCCMEVISNSKTKGEMYFYKGVPVDASYGDLTGDEAALAMSRWDGVSISFCRLPEEKKARQLQLKLMELAGAAWKKTGRKTAGQLKPPAVLRRSGPPGTGPPATSQSKLQAALSRYTEILRTARGYLGLAVLNPEGRVLAADIVDESIDFSKFSTECNSLLARCSTMTVQKGFDLCTTLTVHTQQYVILIKAPDASKHGHFRFIALLSPEGNGYFIQVQLDKIIPRILSAA